MMKRTSFFILFFLLAVVSFAQIDKVPKITVKPGFKLKEIPELEIKNVFFEEDTINIEIEYMGGCKHHYFDLISNDEFTASRPPKLNVYLLHGKKKNDTCSEKVTTTLRYDIVDTQYPSKNEIIILINKNKDYYRYKYEPHSVD